MLKEKTREQLRDEYLMRVDELYAQVRKWITGFDSDAEVTEELITLREEPVEPYQAKVLVISRADYKPVRLIPRGCWIIGAQGRVDMKSDLGTETLLYVSDGGPAIRIDMITENGNVLEEGESRTLANDLARGWVFVQNRQIGMLPSLDTDLFLRLLGALGQ